jgi:hypothetical protein
MRKLHRVELLIIGPLRSSEPPASVGADLQGQLAPELQADLRVGTRVAELQTEENRADSASGAGPKG